jgi:uncharacterized protein (TIGR03435 family)
LNGSKIGALISLLAQELGHPVIDDTGLTGKYDLTLDWASQNTASSSAVSDDTGAVSDAPASIFTAVQEQLGLKLEVRKGPVTYVVIDHLEKPTAN